MITVTPEEMAQYRSELVNVLALAVGQEFAQFEVGIGLGLFQSPHWSDSAATFGLG